MPVNKKQFKAIMCGLISRYYLKNENPITTTPRMTSTIPVARLSVLGVALFAKTAAILAQMKVNITHNARMSQSGEPPIEK